MKEVEKQILSAPGSWILGLVATNRALNLLLVEHIREAGDVVDVVLMDDIFWWYMDVAALGVDLTEFNAYLEEGLRSDRPDVKGTIIVFLERLRSAEQISADDDKTKIMLNALPAGVLAAARAGR